MKDYIKKIVLLANEAGKTVIRSNVVRRIVSSVIAFSVVLSPLAPELAVFAADDGQNEEIIETTTSDPIETDVDEAILPTEITLPDYSEYAIEEPVTVENDDIDVPDPSDDIDTTAPPADDTTETTVEASTEETTQTDTTTGATVVEPSDETVPTETEPSETSATDTTVEPTESVTEPTTDTTEAQQPVEETVCNIVTATSADEYFRLVSELPEGYQRVIVDTTVDLSSLKCAAGVYYDGTYILVFDDADTAASAIYFCDTNGYEYAVDGVLGVCGDGDDVIDAQINPDANVRVAVIDTGSNLANESYSVIGDDVADHNGHGTAMSAYVLNETDDAYIISIKALGDDGRGNMTDVYAAVQLAEELGVDYILMAISIRDNGLYDAFKTLIANTNAQVVAAAGNNGANASRYLPAGIDGVITVGALDENCLLSSYSNYGDCVEYYVMADSTSAATAIALGVIIDGRADMLPDTYPEVHESFEHFLMGRAEDDEFVFITDYPVNSEYISVYEPVAFYVPDLLGSNLTTGTGYNAYLSEENNTTIDGDTLYCVESAKMVPEQSVDQYGRHYNDYGKIDWDDDDDNNVIPFTNSPNVSWVRGTQAACAFGPAGELYSYGVDWWKTHDTGNVIPSSVKNNSTQMKQAMYIITHLLCCKAYSDSWPSGISSNFQSLLDSYYNYVLGVRQGTTTIPGVILSDWWCEWYQCCSFAASGEWSDAEQRYIYNTDYQVVTRGNVEVTNDVSDVDISLTKASTNPAITNSNSCYSLAGTSYGLYGSQADANANTNRLATFTVGADGKTTTTYTSEYGKTYYLKENTAGKGYILDRAIYKVDVSAAGVVTITVASGSAPAVPSATKSGNTYYLNVKDAPGHDPLNIALRKVDKDGNIVHNATLAGAKFRIFYYAQDLGASGNNDAAATVIYEYTLAGSSASIRLSDLQALAPVGGSDTNYLKSLPADWYEYPYGTIRIQEIQAPAGYMINDQIVRYRLGTTVTRTVENNSAYSNRNYWNQLADGTLALTELPEVGYYALTKSLDDTDIRSDLAGFQYELYNTSSQATPVQIATGVSQADGRVLWTYTVQDYYQNTDTTKLLTGTTTYSLELPASEQNASGVQVPISYQVREIKSSVPITYGNTGIAYTYNVPKTSGVAWSNATDYYYKSVTVSNNDTTREGVVNDYDYAGLNVNKVVPNQNPFDMTKVTFKLYNTNGGTDTLIANGTVDSRGNVTWNRVHSSGYGVTPKSSVNVINYLPLGSYRIEEIWDKDYLDVNTSVSILIEEENTNGWTKSETRTTYTYSYNLTLNTDKEVRAISVENRANVQKFNLTKTVTVAGDASTIQAQLYLVTGNVETLVAEGTCATTGVGTFGFTWTYNGTHVTENGLDTLVLPVGQYRVVELCPTTYYKTTHVPYTYKTPAGYSARTVGGQLQFYQDFTLAKGDFATLSSGIENVRIEGSFDIIKTERSGDGTTKTFTFEVYYRGNGTTASSTSTLVERVNITTTNGTGSASLTKLPEGWYEIREVNAGSSWTTHWINNATVSGGNKVVRLDSSNRTNATPTVHDSVLENGTELNAVAVYNDVAPEIRTTLVDRNTTDHVAASAETATLEDTVTYKNVLPGHYVVTGVLMDKKTGSPLLDKSGNQITASKAFDVPTELDTYGQPKPQSGTVTVTYTLDTTIIKDVTLVAYETLHEASATGTVVAKHEDISDANQTVYIPDLKTTLKDTVTGEHVAAETTVELVDTVKYSNLLPGKEYTVSGVLVNAKDGKEMRDSNGASITASTTFTPTAASGSVDITFKFSSGILKGTSVVAFEELKYNNITIATHADISDKDQTVDFPEIHTTLVDTKTKEHIAGQETTIELIDTVAYTNLNPDYEYTMAGTLMDKSTGKGLLDKDGKIVTASKTFKPDAASGTVEIVFTFDGSLLKGDTLVAFENLKYNDKSVATHNDINDKDQTVDIPELKTSFFDIEIGETEDFVRAAQNVTLVDRVYYTNIQPGLEYTVYGSIMVKETNESFKDADGNAVIVSKTFTPSSATGYVDVEFVVDTTLVAGKTLVAFETLDYNGITLVIHANIDDEDQTVHVPDVHTTATDNDNKTHTLTYKDRVTVVDKVVYDNLIPGKTYVVEGTLYNAETGAVYTDTEGKTYKASVEFTPTSASGSVDVIFKDVLVPYTYTKAVVFEDLYDKDSGVKIATHADISDEEQTFERPVAITSAAVDSQKVVWLENTGVRDLTLVDTVIYKGLEVGSEYRAEATLYKGDGTQLMKDGKPVTASVVFVPTARDGSVDVSITFSTEGLAEGDTVVVFEKIFDVATTAEKTAGTQTTDLLIAKHEDINDKDQTITIHFRPMTGFADTPYVTIGGTLILLALGGIAVMQYVRKRKENAEEQ